jgi:hypothetical protein
MTDKSSHIVEITIKSDTPEIVQAFIYGYFGENCNVDRTPEATFKLVVKEEELDYELDLTREKDIEDEREFI